MDNRYLYRAKRLDNGEWVEGYYACYLHGFGSEEKEDHIIRDGGSNLYFVDQSTVSQCAGNQGCVCNVWENQVLQWTDPAYGICTGAIRFGRYLQDGSGSEYPAIPCYGFYVEVVKVEPYPESGMEEGDYPEYLKQISLPEMMEINCDIQLLGNIFDNPELLEKKD